MSGAATSPFGLLTGAVRRALRWAVLGCLALSACQPVHAATVNWSNVDILGTTNDATYLFTPSPAPGTSGGAFVTGGSVSATTTNGAGTIVILAGRYTGRAPGRNPFVFWVPQGPGPYNLTQLYLDANGGVVAADAPFLPTVGGELTGNLRFSGVLSGGVIPPHLTTAQRDSLNTVSNGMLIFNVTLGTNQVRGPGGWFNFPGGTDTNQFATLATLTNVANAQAQAALQSSTNYTDGVVGLYTLLSTFESATNTLTGLINSAGVSAETATNIARSVVAQSNLVNQSQLSTATGAVYAAIPDTSTLATKAALEATNAALVALIDSETAPFINAAQATNIAAYQALIVSNGVTLLIPSTNGLASIPFVTATSNALQSQIGSAGISAETGTNIARAVVGQSNLVTAAQVAAQIASSNLVTASITNDLASIEYARSLTNNFATQAFVTTATNTLDGKFASYTTLTLTTNIANAVGQVVSNAVVLLIPSTNGFITLAQLTVASNALQTQIDAIDGVTSAEATNIAASVVGGSNYVTLATLNTSSNAIRAAIPSTNGFVTQTITNGLASIYFVQAVSNWVPTQIQSTNGLASTNWVASYNYHAQTNGVLPRWAAETLTADGRYGVNLNSSDGEINLLSSGEIVLESSTGLRLLTSSGQVNVENSDLTVDGNFVAGGAMFGSAGTGLTNIHWPGPGISNVVAGDGILISTNTGVLVIEATGTGGGATNGITGTQATNIWVGLAIESNYLKTATFNTSIADYAPLTLATNLRTLVILTNSGATFLTTNASQITAVINTNVSGGGSTNGLASIEYVDDSVNGASNVLYGLIGEGGATLSQVTNTVEALAVLANQGTGTSNTFIAPALVDPGAGAFPVSVSVTNMVGFFDVRRYGASGSTNRTTGTIASGSRTLVVASASDFRVGQGVFVDNAAAGSSNLVATITNISGTTFTLDLPAGIGATNAIVQHDDSAAINRALAAAYAAGGGQVYIPRQGTLHGWYRVNGPLQSATDSILSVPAPRLGSVTFPPLVEIIGDGNAGSTNFGQNLQVGYGTVLDATDNEVSHLGGIFYPAVLAGSRYTNYNNLSTEAYHLNLHVDKLTILVPSNPTLGGINMSHIQRGSVGDHVTVTAKINIFDLGNATYQPTYTNTFGVFFPTINNNVMCFMGQSWVAGFWDGIRTAEHMELRGPYLYYCRNGIRAMAGNYPIVGSAKIENCTTLINTYDPYLGYYGSQFDLTLQVEIATNAAWYSTTNTFFDPQSRSRGYIKTFAAVGGVGWTQTNLMGTANGFTNTQVWDGNNPDFRSRKLVTYPTYTHLESGAIITTNITTTDQFGTSLQGLWNFESTSEIKFRNPSFSDVGWMQWDVGSERVTGATNKLVLRADVGIILSANGTPSFEVTNNHVRMPNGFYASTNIVASGAGFVVVNSAEYLDNSSLQVRSANGSTYYGKLEFDGVGLSLNADTLLSLEVNNQVLAQAEADTLRLGPNTNLVANTVSTRFRYKPVVLETNASWQFQNAAGAAVVDMTVSTDGTTWNTVQTNSSGAWYSMAGAARQLLGWTTNSFNFMRWPSGVLTDLPLTNAAAFQPANGVLTNLAANAANTVTNVVLLSTNNTGSAGISAGTLTILDHSPMPTTITNLATTWGIDMINPVTGSAIISATNRPSDIATNATVAHLDYSNFGRNDYYLQPMRGNITIYLTNLVSGRSINLFLYGSTNASDNFTATFSTNNTVGRLRWNIYSPTNGLNVVTVTNNLLMEFSLKALPNGEVSIHPGVSR